MSVLRERQDLAIELWLRLVPGASEVLSRMAQVYAANLKDNPNPGDERYLDAALALIDALDISGG